jgi:hypothetical protein
VVGGCGYSGLGLATQSSLPARARSCLDALLTGMLMDHIRPMLEADGLWEAFTKVSFSFRSFVTKNQFWQTSSVCRYLKSWR